MNGERLKELRKKHKLTQVKLASLLHVEQSSVSDWERGKTKPDFENQRKLADIYGITIDELFERTVQQATRVERINDNHGIIGTVNAPTTLNNTEYQLSTFEKELLRLFDSVGVKEQMQILQYAYSIAEESEEIKE